MPLGGGNFTAENKVLPGAYLNFVTAQAASTAGIRGTVTLPLALNWGKDGEMITVHAAEFAKKAVSILGYDASAPELLLVREALKNAHTLLAYRVNGGGIAAKKTIGGIEWTAICTGTRGNAIKGAVQPNIDVESLFDVVTYLGQTEVDRQTVAAAEDLHANDYVTFGAGTLAAEAAVALAGGTNGTMDGAAYATYLEKAEVEDFDAIGYPGSDTTTKQLFKAFAVRLNDTEGKKLQCVLCDFAADHEAIINVKNGVKLQDGTVITADKAVAWVAGASAAADISQSLTNVAYPGAVDVDVRYTQTEYAEAVKAGQFAFYGENGAARVVADINSLVTSGDNKPEDVKHNRVVRVLNGWANDVARIFGTSYLGRQTNNDTGRQLFKADLVALAAQYQAKEAISNFNANDVTISQGTGKRDIVVTNSLQPNDSMEKLYVTTQVL